MSIKINKITGKKPINIEKLGKMIPDEKRGDKDLFNEGLSKIFITFNGFLEHENTSQSWEEGDSVPDIVKFMLMKELSF